MKLKKTDGFRAAFAKAKEEKKKTFMWNGKTYTTQTAEEKALKMSDKELAEAQEKAHVPAKMWAGSNTDKSKSASEIHESYINEELYRLGDKKKKLRDEGKSTRFDGSFFAVDRPSRLKK